MLKQEFAKVRKNRLLMITLTVVMLIPSIYSTIFLKSMWDTYERMDNFPVAVVNKDKAASKMGKEINIGEELTNTLDESKEMDFQPMSAEEARAGLDEGKYFMAITIPEDFSADSMTLMDKNPKQMNLTYETSAGHNFTASKFSEIAAGRIKNEVQNNVTRTYAQTVLGQFKKAGLGLEQAGEGANTLANGLTQLSDGSGQLEDGVNKLSDGLGEFGPGLATYTGGVGQAANGSHMLASGGIELQSGIAKYTDGVNQAANSAPQLLMGLQQYTTGVDTAAAASPELAQGVMQYTDGVNKAASSVPELNKGIQQYTNGVDKAASSVPELNQGIKQYTDGVNQAAAKAPELATGVEQYTAGVKQANDGSKQVADGSKQVADGLAELNKSLQSTDVKKLTAGMTEYKKQVAQLKAFSDGKSPAQAQIMMNMNNMATQLQALGALAQSKDLSAADRATLMQSIGALKTNLEELGKTLEAQAKQAGQLGALADGYDTLYAGMTGYVQKTQAASNQLAPGAKKVADGAGQLDAGLATLTAKNKQVNDGTAQLVAGLQQLEANSGKLSVGSDQLTSGLQQLQANSGKLTDGTGQLTNGLQQLEANSGALSDGAQQLAGGLGQLQANSGKLTDGTGQLTNGLQQLQANSGALQNGTNAAVGGINELNAGLMKLNDNSGRLESAVSQLSDGSGQLADGAQKLNVGLVKANDGAEELGEKLTEGGEQVKQVRDDKANLDMFATPITETHEDRTSVKNNGTGMAPYMIAIYVFVGMITLMAAMNLTEPAGYPKSSFTWWLSKYTIPFVIVFVGAIITTLVSISIIGLTPVNTSAFLVSLIVIAIMDMSIVYFFTAAFGKIGTFLSLILLVLQLSGSGGTYPIQLSSEFFQWLHPLLPMTYAIEALRGSLSTGLSVTQPVTIMFMIFVVFSLLSWLYFAIQKSKRYRFDETMSNKSDLNN